MSLSATVLVGIVSALVMYMGTRQIYAHTLTVGDLFRFVSLLAMMTAPINAAVKSKPTTSNGKTNLFINAVPISKTVTFAPAPVGRWMTKLFAMA